MRLFVAALLAALLSLMVVPSSASAETWKQWDRARVNSLRAAHHLPPLTYRRALQDEAQWWANRMAARDRVQQNFHAGPCWVIASANWFGDNVGVGPSVPWIERYFERSPSHRANLLDRDFRFLGIGVAYSHGWVWVDQVFCG